MESSNWLIDGAFEAEADIDLGLQILKRRGISRADQRSFLRPDYQSDLYDPWLLPGLTKAVERIFEAIDRNEQVIVYGDYDIDGLSAAIVLQEGLKQFGAQVNIYIPDRFEEGYGLNIKALESLQASGANLVVSVDCGITAKAEVDFCQQIGLGIVITDHHQPASELPVSAVALVDPKLSDSNYPFRELAGVGVAFKLICALQKQRPDKMLLGQEKWLLDLVALGTICDVVPLVSENRVLVSYGLQVMAKSRRPGLRALAAVCDVRLDRIKSMDLAFRLGPRLNAAGRLEHAKLSLDLLLTDDQAKAELLADKLDRLNTERQQLTEKIYQEADVQAQAHQDQSIIVLADPSWSHGVVGIVASRLSEKWHKPVILMQILGQRAKGSARSVEAVNIIDAINSAKDLLITAGGHQFAAGLTINTVNIDDFRLRINEYGARMIDKSQLAKKIAVDLILNENHFNLESCQQISSLEPFGNANSQPIFMSHLKINWHKAIGHDLKHLKLYLETPNQRLVDGIAFNAAGKWPWIVPGQRVVVLYKLEINDWRDRSQLQLEVIDLKPVDDG